MTGVDVSHYPVITYLLLPPPSPVVCARIRVIDRVGVKINHTAILAAATFALSLSPPKAFPPRGISPVELLHCTLSYSGSRLMDLLFLWIKIGS